jgi:hypothetical protein
LKSSKGIKRGKDIQHILRLEPDVNNRRRRRSTIAEYQFAEISVASDERPVGRNRVGQDFCIAAIGDNLGRTHDVISLSGKRKRDPPPDIRVANELQAARARPAAM